MIKTQLCALFSLLSKNLWNLSSALGKHIRDTIISLLTQKHTCETLHSLWCYENHLPKSLCHIEWSRVHFAEFCMLVRIACTSYCFFSHFYIFQCFVLFCILFAWISKKFGNHHCFYCHD